MKGDELAEAHGWAQQIADAAFVVVRLLNRARGGELAPSHAPSPFDPTRSNQEFEADRAWGIFNSLDCWIRFCAPFLDRTARHFTLAASRMGRPPLVLLGISAPSTHALAFKIGVELMGRAFFVCCY